MRIAWLAVVALVGCGDRTSVLGERHTLTWTSRFLPISQPLVLDDEAM